MIKFAMSLVRKGSTLDRLRASMIVARSIPHKIFKTTTMRELVLWVLDKKTLPLEKLIQMAKTIPDNGQTLCLLAQLKEVILARRLMDIVSETREAFQRGPLANVNLDEENPKPASIDDLNLSSIDNLLEIIESLPENIDFPSEELYESREEIKTKDQYLRYLALKRGIQAKNRFSSKKEACPEADAASTIAQLIQDKEIRRETICRLFLKFMHMNFSGKKKTS